MYDIFFDHYNRQLNIILNCANPKEVNGWLLKSDGTLAQKLKIITSLQFDCTHLQAGNWFVKIEMPGYTGLKKFTIPNNFTDRALVP